MAGVCFLSPTAAATTFAPVLPCCFFNAAHEGSISLRGPALLTRCGLSVVAGSYFSSEPRWQSAGL